jgi:riboflavin kinase/FMN adenylyltransferase
MTTRDVIPAVVVTLGVMDGFHRGHAKVMAEAAEVAHSAGARLAAFTFDPPPWVVLSEKPEEPLLTLLDERVALMRGGGADEVRVLRFDPRLAAKSPEDFLIEHVFPFGRLAALVLGYDFALGHERRGSPEMLSELGRRWGFSVASVPAMMEEGTPISSSRIRMALREGRVEDAARWLGRPYSIYGTVVRGEGRGKGLGFPTANLELSPRRVRPALGVYAVRVRGLGREPRPGVANLGRRPTFDGQDERLEVHVLEPVGDLTGTRLDVDVVARIRPELKFNSPKELSEQIARDVTQAKSLLQAGQPLS